MSDSSKKQADILHYNIGNRLGIIEKALQVHNPGISPYEIEAALNWALKHSTKNLPKDKRSIDNTFVHPLKMVEYLIKDARADRETILAAILYPAFCVGKETLRIESRPLEGQPFFDNLVRRLIERTLLFRAQNLPDLKPGAQQKREEQINLFRLMSLWATECDPRAIMIRGVQLVFNLEKILDQPDFFTPQETKTILRTADQVYAQLTYLAGYGQLRSQIMDLSLKIQNPEAYDEIVEATQRRLGVTEQEREANRKAIIRRMAESVEVAHGLRHGYDFEVEFRPKSPGSAYAKIIRKNKALFAAWRKEHPDDPRSDEELKQEPTLKDRVLTVENLGDLLAARIIPKKPMIAAWAEQHGFTGQDKRSIQERAQHFTDKANLIYNGLSHRFGRNNHELTHTRITHDRKGKVISRQRYSYIQERFAHFAVVDPANDNKPCADDRYDNYYLNRKADGYAGIHDTLFIDMPGREFPIEIECQIVDEVQHDLNTHGPRRGHIYYKSGMENYSENVIVWKRRASAILTGRRPKKNSPVLVVDHLGQIFDISDDPTVRGLFRKTGIECSEAFVTHPYNPNYAPRPGKNTYGPSSKLDNGCIVAPVLIPR